MGHSMHRWQFPACPVDGPFIPPRPFSHLGIDSSIPNKCATCDQLFEGCCSRHTEDLGRFLSLDYGPCGIDGPTDPVDVVLSDRNLEVQIPRKCESCEHREDSRCSKDPELWGHNQRALDWADWSPPFIYVELPSPKASSAALSQFAGDDDLVSFVKEYRRINPSHSVTEAKSDFALIRAVQHKCG